MPSAIQRASRWLMDSTSRAVSVLEADSFSLGNAVLVFFCAVILRNGAEVTARDDTFDWLRMAHYWLFYVSAALAISLLLSVATRTDAVKSLKTVLPSCIVLLVTPLADLVWTCGQGADISYLTPGFHDDYVVRFFTFWGAYGGSGASPGLRLEVALVLLGCFLYARSKGASVARGLLMSFACYALIYLHGAVPYVLDAHLRLIGLRYQYDEILLAGCFAISSLGFGLALAYRARPVYFRAFVGDLRWTRVIYYLLLYFLGFLFDCRSRAPHLDSVDFLDPLLASLAIVFAILFAIVVNNLHDAEIDRVASPERPLFREGIDRRVYGATALPFLAVALVLAALAGFYVFFGTLFFASAYHLYSAPPLRWKRVPILSKLTIGANSLAVLLAGYLEAGGQIADVPPAVFAVFLIGFTLVANFIDLKDAKGDRSAGIRTLPVLLGMRRAQIALGLLFAALYFGLYAVIGDRRLLPAAVVFGALELFLVTRKRYREPPVFVVLDLSVLGFIAYVVWLAPFDSMKALGTLVGARFGAL